MFDVANGITYMCGIDIHLSSRPPSIFLMISENTNFKMPVCRKKFNALKVPNLLTDYDPDFLANFLDDIVSKIGVSPALFTVTLIMARLPAVNSTLSPSVFVTTLLIISSFLYKKAREGSWMPQKGFESREGVRV